MRSLLPLVLAALTTIVARAPAQAADPLPRGDAKAEDVDPVGLARLHDLIGEHVRKGSYAGAALMVVRRGKIVDWQTYGVRDVETGAPMERDTIVRIYSMSKVVTAIAALQLVEQNRIGLDAPIAEWVPELREPKVLTGGTADAPQLAPAERPITVRMLLNHTAGLTYDFGNTSPVHELYRRKELWSAASLDEFIAKVAELPLLAQPGTAWNYSISDDVLGAVIERASGEKLETYVARHVTEPLRMHDTGFDVPAEKMGRLGALHAIAQGTLRTTEPTFGSYAEPGRGFAAGGAGMFSTIGDYARFAQMIANGGALDGARILGRKMLELARRSSLRPEMKTFTPGDSWGLFSAVRTDVAASGEPSSEGMLYWSGAASTTFFVDPAEQLVGLLFCQHFPFDQHGLLRKFRTAVYAALE